ncbi:MAG TPA: hypothetical protein DCO79_05910, partial [Spirochaeta sp.]|nr:hypothetical protein [Spirochaeta sp.]
VDAADVYFVRQQHSKRIVSAESWTADPLTGADGIISRRVEDKIAVTIADCMPIFLHDAERNIRAILHSGWKGTGIVLEAIKIMKKQYGCSPGDLTAVLGPAIGSCCYNVDDERAAVFQNAWGSDAVAHHDGGKYLSLKNANINMLERAGVNDIISTDLCTSCSGGLGSYRREGADNFTQMFCLSYQQ